MKLENWSKVLDSKLNKKFDTDKFKTSWSIFNLSLMTTFGDDEPMTSEMKFYIDGFMSALESILDSKIKVIK